MRKANNRFAYRLLLMKAVFLSLVVASPASAITEEQLPPTSPWQLDQGEQSCMLSRAFGSEDAPLILYFERFAPGDLFQLVISTKLAEDASPPYKIAIEYGVGGYVHEADYLPGRTSNGTPTMWISSSTLGYRGKSKDGKPVISPDQEAAVREISLSPVGGKKLVLKTGSLGSAFATLHKCTDDLIKSWGLDPEQQRNLVSHAKPKSPPASWIQNSDYPQDIKPDGTMVIVNFRLIVNANGKPTSCQITRSYFGEKFDTLSCNLLLQSARFDPAIDALGKPISSYYTNTIRWAM